MHFLKLNCKKMSYRHSSVGLSEINYETFWYAVVVITIEFIMSDSLGSGLSAASNFMYG